MALNAHDSVRQADVGEILSALARHEGSASHSYPIMKLSAGAAVARDLADAVHYLCTLHGRQPGVIDLAATRPASPRVNDWAGAAVAGFARERAYLTRVVVAAGPLPSTPGQAESGAAGEGAVVVAARGRWRRLRFRADQQMASRSWSSGVSGGIGRGSPSTSCQPVPTPFRRSSSTVRSAQS